MKKIRQHILTFACGVALSLGAGIASADIVTLSGTVRDFKGFNEAGGHVDFENGCCGLVTGMVSTTLGLDGNPVFVGAPGYGFTDSAASFNQWWNDTPGVNLSQAYTLNLDNGLGATPGGTNLSHRRTDREAQR